VPVSLAPMREDERARDLSDVRVTRVGGDRNAFGTRISRRVACIRCGAVDHVAYVPKNLSRALCRNCAAETLKAYELGVRVPTAMRDEKCNLCGTPFQMPQSVKDDGDPLCSNCLRGFCTWSGNVDVPYEDRAKMVTETRGKRLLARRPKDDA
jgi:hypothetical protein